MKLRASFFALLVAAMFAAGLVELRVQSVANPPTQAKEIVMTIDDLPLNGPRIDITRLKTMTDRIMSGIATHKIPAIGFVNESLLYVPGEVDARIAILKQWTDAGVELGNHTFSHMGFRDATLAAYQNDFVRGDAITAMLMKQKRLRVRYFRHPYLQMGKTVELEKAFESFIGERGYKIAPVTVDTMDWMFLAAYARARTQGDKQQIKLVSEEYLKYVALRLDFSERVAVELFGRPIRHILLMHANELNADNFDGLIGVIKSKGYQFVALERALTDSVYEYPDKYQATSDWLSHWSFSKGKRLDAPAPPEFISKAFAEATSPSR